MNNRMKLRRGVSPVLGLIVVIMVGFSIASLLYFSDTAAPSIEIQKPLLMFINIYQTKPVSVDEAGWQLVLLVQNQGNGEGKLDHVYLNGEQIEETGYNHGDTLPSKTSIATSIPSGGLIIPGNSQATVYIWIGMDRYSRGTQLTIELQKPNQLMLQKTITLN